MKILLCSPVVGVSAMKPGGIAVGEHNVFNQYKAHSDGMQIYVHSLDKHEYINENTGKVNIYLPDSNIVDRHD